MTGTDTTAAFEQMFLLIQREVGAQAARKYLWEHKLDLLDVLHAAREMQRTSGGPEEGDAWVNLSRALRELDADV